MLSEFFEFLPKNNNTIQNIKLRNLLEFHRQYFGLRSTRLLFPPIEIGSITLVDQIVLLALMDICAAKTILEIGTFQGYTTRMFLENCSSASKVISVDLPRVDDIDHENFDKDLILSDGDYNDRYLTSLRDLKGEIYLKDLDQSYFNRLLLVKQNSTTIDYKTLYGDIDFAFIDGGHDINTVRMDTQRVRNAVKLGVIVWHDFSSNIHSGVTHFLENENENSSIFHVTGSLCAFEIRGV